AEDGIRDFHVTGVQTCALPILLDARGFAAEDFARSHPGGALGRRLLTHVGDVMRPAQAVPRVGSDAPLTQALLAMTAGGMGMTRSEERRVGKECGERGRPNRCA